MPGNRSVRSDRPEFPAGARLFVLDLRFNICANGIAVRGLDPTAPAAARIDPPGLTDGPLFGSTNARLTCWPATTAIENRTRSTPMLIQIFGLFFDVVAPVFGIVLLGYTVGPRLRLEARSLSRVAYYVFLPAFVFNAISTADFELAQVTRAVGYIVAVHLTSAFVGFLTARLLRRSWEITAAYVLIALLGNVGNFGVAIIGFKMGPKAVPVATLYFVAINMTAFIIGVGFASWLRRDRGWLSAVLTIFKTPAIIVMVPALLFQAGGLAVPLMPARIIGLLAGAMIPTLLFVVGQHLAESGPMKLNRDVYVASAIRLVVTPLLALALAGPLAVDGFDRGAGILQAGMPVAVLATIIAMEFDLVPKFVTTVLFFTTLASLLTITVMLYLL